MSQTIPARIVIRRDTAANWTTVNPVLLNGEWGFETDARKLKIGDGVSTWAALSYFSTGGGGGSGNTAYVHQQATAATTWTINHGLGYRPSVELLDSGSQEIDGDVSHPSVYQTVVTLNPATAGLARLI